MLLPFFAHDRVMARYKTPQISEFPFHITSRTPNRCPFPIPLDRVWEIMSYELYWCHKKYNLQTLSFVLMPNHFHLIARTQDVALGKILNDLMRDTSKRINKEAGRINQNWGEVAYRTQIADLRYYFNVYKYVYQNPLRAKLCKNVMDYPYSTLHGKLGRSHLFIPTMEDTTLFEGPLEANLKWLNKVQEPDEVEYIRTGLKYQKFHLKKDSNQRVLLMPDTPPTGK